MDDLIPFEPVKLSLISLTLCTKPERGVDALITVSLLDIVDLIEVTVHRTVASKTSCLDLVIAS